MRAISTVIDVALCLLLVSASVLTLAGTPIERATEPDAAADAADETAETLATSTARVTYRTANDHNRTVHDTLAGLLASAATVDETSDFDSASAFVAAVTASVNRTLRRAPVGVQVIARRETSDRPSNGRVVAGETPPPDADVHAAAFSVRRVGLTVRTWDR